MNIKANITVSKLFYTIQVVGIWGVLTQTPKRLPPTREKRFTVIETPNYI
eukprot:SAG22_NODE_9142_length_607_cov_2.244094_1_plen_49_part_10